MGSEGSGSSNERARPRRATVQVVTSCLVSLAVGLALLQTGSAAQVTARACIWGQAWSDTDASGTRTENEVAAPGIVVELLSVDGQVVAAANSWPSGDYRFTDLLPGTYRLRFTPPDGTDLTPPQVDDDTTRDSDADPATGETDDLELSPGDVAGSVDVGVLGADGLPLPGIGDRVWADRNLDGVQGRCEPGVGDIPVDLLGSDRSVVERATTNAEGHYFFPNLASGSYVVRFSPPAFDDFTRRDVGEDDLDSDVDPSTGETEVIAFAVGDRITSIDAGLTPSVAASTTTTMATTTTTTTSTTRPTGTSVATTNGPTTTAPPPIPPPTVLPPPTTAPPPATGASQPDQPVSAEPEPDDEVLGTSVLGPSTSTTALSSSSTTAIDLPATSGDEPPPPADRETQLDELVDSLEPGSLKLDASECVIVDSDQSPLDGLEVDCDNLVIDQQFILTVALLRAAPPEGADTNDDAAEDDAAENGRAVGPQPIETTFLMRVRVTYPDTRVAIAETPGTSVTAPVAQAELEIARGRQSSATFAITPKVEGTTELNVRIDALSADGQAEQQVGTAKVRLRVAPSPAGPVLSGGGNGGISWWLSLLLLIPLLGAATFTVRKRRGTALIDPAPVAPVVAAVAGEHPRVFISYSRDDTARIHRLSTALERAGIDTWIDSGDIEAGDVWKEKIVSGLQQCDLVVLAISRTSVESNNVATEVSIGRSHGKPVLPVHLHDDVALSARMQYDLADIQYVEMFDDRKPTLDRVVAEVNRLLDADDTSG